MTRDNRRWVISVRDGDEYELSFNERDRLKRGIAVCFLDKRRVFPWRRRRRRRRRVNGTEEADDDDDDGYLSFATRGISDRIIEDLSTGTPIRATVRWLSQSSDISKRTARHIGKLLHKFLLEVKEIDQARVTSLLPTPSICFSRRVRLFKIGADDLRHSTWNNFVELFKVECIGRSSSSENCRYYTTVLQVGEGSGVFVRRDNGECHGSQWKQSGGRSMYQLNGFAISCLDDDDGARAAATELFAMLLRLLSKCHAEASASLRYVTFVRERAPQLPLTEREIEDLVRLGGGGGEDDDVDDSRCRSLDIRYFKLTAGQVRVLMKTYGAFSTTTSKSHIALNGCTFLDSGDSFVRCLERDDNPTSLCVRECLPFDDVFVEKFCRALRKNVGLKSLDLSFHDVDISPALEAARENRGLRRLELFSCGTTNPPRDGYWKTLCDAIRSHPELETINLHLYVEDEALPAIDTVSPGERVDDLAEAVRCSRVVKNVGIDIDLLFSFRDGRGGTQYLDDYGEAVANRRILPVLVLNRYRENVRRISAAQTSSSAIDRRGLLGRALARVCKMENNQDLVFHMLTANVDFLFGGSVGVARGK